jgi:hypothetical protein
MKYTNTDCVREEVYGKVDDQMDDQVYWEVGDQLYWQACKQMDRQVKGQINPIQNKISQEINKI